MTVTPRFSTKRDPVISELCRQYGDTSDITTGAVRDSLRYAPYKSVAPQLLERKADTDNFLVGESDTDKLNRAHLQSRLHGLELQRLETEKQARMSRLGHQEGNVQLREIATLVGDVTSKLNAIESEQASFNQHIHDLRAKNEALVDKLEAMKMEEKLMEKKANELAEEKVRLAQKLAEVTQQHTLQQKALADQAARRECVEDALTHLHQDADRYTQEIRDLADKRRNLERELHRLKFSERETEKRIGQFDEEHGERMKVLAGLLGEIEKIQTSIAKSMPSIPDHPLKPGVRPVPLSQAPPSRIASDPIKRLSVARTDALPPDYEPSRMSTADIPVPDVPRGLYEASAPLSFPEPPEIRMPKDDSYYSSEIRVGSARAGRPRPLTAATSRTRYVGINTVNAASSQNFTTGLARPGTATRPFANTSAPHSLETTYGHYYGREGRGSVGRSMLDQRS